MFCGCQLGGFGGPASPSAGVCQCGGLRPLLGGSCSGRPTSPVSCPDRLFVSPQIAGLCYRILGTLLTDRESMSLFANVVRRGPSTFYPLDDPADAGVLQDDTYVEYCKTYIDFMGVSIRMSAKSSFHRNLTIILTPRRLDSCCCCVTEKSKANTLSDG